MKLYYCSTDQKTPKAHNQPTSILTLFFLTASHAVTSDASGISCCQFYSYLLQIRPSQILTTLLSGRLLQQFLVDMYIKIESTRLDYIRANQDTIRADLYQGIVGSVTSGKTRASNIGKRIVLPASFISGPQDMKRRYLDAMTLVQRYGKPDIYLTMTCNPSWPEIKAEELHETEEAQNRQILSLVFSCQNCGAKE